MDINFWQLNTHQWISLPQEVRNKLIEIFNIPKSEGIIGTTTGLISDGHSNKDLAFISVDKINEFLSTNYKNKEYFIAFEKVLEKINGNKIKGTNENGRGDEIENRSETKRNGSKARANTKVSK